MNAKEQKRILDSIGDEYWYPDPGGHCRDTKGKWEMLVSMDGFFTVPQLRAIADYAEQQQAEFKK